jgi:hypothetical protein
MQKYTAILLLLSAIVVGAVLPPARTSGTEAGQASPFVIEREVAVPMRDGVVLRADVWRPHGPGPFPVLVYRTPYNRRAAPEGYATFRKAVERGYAVVIQDVRGRYGSEGEFLPYQQEGKDGYDTIEWAARQPWSNGAVGTFGLSYPGAVQWLAAMERPPHLKAMVPAMTFSTPRNFFYSNGVFDLSWIGWIWNNIAPDVRARKNLAGPKTGEEARRAWEQQRLRLQRFLPLGDLPALKDVAPWYFEWMRHPPEDDWWEWCELRGKYDRVDAAVLNLSGWYDEAYGPEGAITNFLGLAESRRGKPLRAALLIGPWVHGVGATAETRAGEREFGPAARIDYDEVVLRWMDYHVKGVQNGVEREKPVRYFVMGSNAWREEAGWPPAGRRPVSLYLTAPGEDQKAGGLNWTTPARAESSRMFVSDPAHPVTDPHPPYSGAHDYREMAGRDDVLIYETPPLERDLEVSGPVTAEIYLSADAPDTDLWVRLLDVAPDGTALNLMSPGLDVLRASYREPARGRQLLEPGKVYPLRIPSLVTSNTFRKGHRIRVQISAAFFPHFSRNLHTGKLETESAEMRRAAIRIHHDRRRASRLLLPVVGAGPSGR